MSKKPDLTDGEFCRVPVEEYFILAHQGLALKALKRLGDEHRSLVGEYQTKARKLKHFMEALHVRSIDAGQAELFPREQLITPELKELLGL